MENKENKIKAVKLSDDELENVSGGADTVTVSGVTCSKCGCTINGTARFYPDTGNYRCPNCYIPPHVLE